MNSCKRYASWLIGLVSAYMLFLICTGIYIEPLSGDQTRLGAFAEYNFGWNRPQQVFPGRAPALRQAYDQYSDVLVVGDSFSFAGNYDVPNYPWQTFLATKTGLSIATVSHYMKTEVVYDPEVLPSIIKSDAFRKTPPRVLIVEVIERQLDILPDFAGDCRLRQDVQGLSLSLRPRSNLEPSRQIFRKTSLPPLKIQVAYAKKYLLGLLPWMHNKDPLIYRLDLSTGNLFSNRQSDKLLAYRGDIMKKRWDEAKIASIQCKFINLQNLVQGNGETLFVAMVVPDKLTAYSKYLKDQSLAGLSVIDRLASNPSLHLVRIDRAIKAAIDDGLVDIYLPNDTHWAYRGHELAAEALADYLKALSGK